LGDGVAEQTKIIYFSKIHFECLYNYNNINKYVRLHVRTWSIKKKKKLNKIVKIILKKDSRHHTKYLYNNTNVQTS